MQLHDVYDLHVVNTINLITNNSSQHTAQKTKDGVTWTPQNMDGELRYTVRVTSSCYISVIRRVNVKRHEHHLIHMYGNRMKYIVQE